jgi:TonB family protein
MTGELLDALLRVNLAAGAAIVAAILLRAPLRRAVGARAAYGLWALPVVMAVVALLPPPQAGAWYAPAFVVVPSLPVGPAPSQAAGDWRPLALAAWIFGAAACAALLALRQRRFKASLGVLRPARSGGRRVLQASRAGVGPAVVGAAIVIPADFEARFSAEEQQAILAHEGAHLARGDVLANLLVAAAQCLCWFNPLVHLAAFLSRLDQELACDATVIAARPELRRSYAEALLKTQLLSVSPPLGCTWPSRAEHPLKERIVMLKSSPPTRLRRSLGATVLVALALGGGYTAWAAQAGEPRVIARPDWVERPTGQDMARFYPAAAVQQKLSGRVVAQCRVEVSGLLSGCEVVDEAPQGAGFGEASLQLTTIFRMKPLSRDGEPVAGGVVRIPIMFRIASEAAPAAAPAPAPAS